jgi:hypothetical protein
LGTGGAIKRPITRRHKMNIRYPKAEAIANNLPIQQLIVIDENELKIDVVKAKRQIIKELDYHFNNDMIEVAINILEERLNLLK